MNVVESLLDTNFMYQACTLSDMASVTPSIQLRLGVGYCATTDVTRDDCPRIAASGSWPARHNGIRDLTGCVRKCQRCARCAFISFSRANDDCSWFTACRLPLRLEFHGETYRTVQVRNLTESTGPPLRAPINPVRHLVGSCPGKQLTASSGEGDCDSSGTAGRWRASSNGITDLASCAAQCMRCPRCAFASFSAEEDACEWRRECSLPLLQDAHLSFATVQVRSVNATAPASQWLGLDARRLAAASGLAAIELAPRCKRMVVPGLNAPRAGLGVPLPLYDGSGAPPAGLVANSPAALSQFCLDAHHPCAGSHYATCTAAPLSSRGARKARGGPSAHSSNCTRARLCAGAAGNHSRLATRSAARRAQRAGPNRTLVIVMAETRAANATWDRFAVNVLGELSADLALCVRADDAEVHGRNGYHQHARFVWTFVDPPNHEWGPVYDAAYVVSRGGDASAAAEWRELLKVGGELWGGVAQSHNIGSCAVNIYVRWLIRQRLAAVLHLYDRFVLTRSDFAHCAPHPQVGFSHIWHPRGEEDWYGLTDRHSVYPARLVLAAVAPLARLFEDPRAPHGRPARRRAR